MKKFFAVMVLAVMGLTASASALNDTIVVSQSQITKVIVDTQKSARTGKDVTKYYFVVDGELVDTNKTTVDKLNLCKKHGVKCALLMIKSKTKRRIVLG